MASTRAPVARCALALAENDDPAAVSSVIDAYDADELRLASDELYAGVRMANSARTKRRATWQRALGIVGKARDQIHRGSLPKQSRDDFRALEASLRGEAEQVVRIGDFAATHERARPGDQADWDVYAMSLAVGSVAARAFVDWGNDQREPGERTLFAGGNDLFQTGPGPDARLYAGTMEPDRLDIIAQYLDFFGRDPFGQHEPGFNAAAYEIADWLRAGAARMRVESKR